MKNKNGQSIIEIVFSMGVVVLVLTGVVILMVNVASSKGKALERAKAFELSQILMENEVLRVRDIGSSFWDGTDRINKVGQTDVNFDGYLYDVQYGDNGRVCDNKNCVIIFTVRWNNSSQSLSVERFFSKSGT